MKSNIQIRQEIWDLTYKWCVEANYETEQFIDELFEIFKPNLKEKVSK